MHHLEDSATPTSVFLENANIERNNGATSMIKFSWNGPERHQLYFAFHHLNLSFQHLEMCYDFVTIIKCSSYAISYRFSFQNGTVQLFVH